MWQTIKDFPKLVFINLAVSVSGFIEYLRVVKRYYSNTIFLQADLALLKAYLLRSPYRIHKQFLKKQKQEDVYLYGETYLTSLEILANNAKIKPEDIYVELGCGRARTCFWMRCIKQCQVIGIDYVPEFIQIANRVKEQLKLDQLQFFCTNFLEDEWPTGTVYYIDATLSEGDEIACLIRHFDTLPAGTRVIGVNFSLTGDFEQERPQWKKTSVLNVAFPWGEAEVSFFTKQTISFKNRV